MKHYRGGIVDTTPTDTTGDAAMKRQGAGSAQKGAAFERWVGKQLSLWLTGGTDGTQLIRSVSSGGWLAGGPKSDAAYAWRHAGDLAPNGPRGDAFRRRFAVECKFRKVISVGDLLLRPDGGIILPWWEKIADESAQVGVTPLLICKANHQLPLVVAPHSLMTRRSPDGWLLSAVHRTLTIAPWALVVFPFTELLACDPARLMEEE